MKKNKKILLILVLLIAIMPHKIYASNSSTGVGSNLSVSQCTGKYQDNTIYTAGDTYFSHCAKAVCKNREYKITNHSSEGVVCTNGNSNPYRTITKNGCSKYKTSPCNEGATFYCSKLEYVDCSRNSDGSTYNAPTTTTTKKYTPTTQAPTTTQPTTQAPSNTKLKSITLSTGKIDFKPTLYSYTLTIDAIVNSIDVTAVPEDSSSKVSVSGNTNLKDGSVITIRVTGSDNSESNYKINIKKNDNVKLSSNTSLKSLTVENYPLDFNSKINSYNLTIDEGVTSLNIDYEAEDKSSIVMIRDNENLHSGSKITISVTAADGSVGYYTLNITVKKKSNFLKILFVIIIILAALIGGYYIYRKFILAKNGEKYEYE